MSSPLMLIISWLEKGNFNGLDLLALSALVGLAVWRVSHIVLYESGPYGLVRRFRERVGVTHNEDTDEPETHVHEWTHCIWCLSVWVAIILLCVPIGVSIMFACSAAAIWFNGVINGHR